MILLTNGDSWTQGDSPAQTINWESSQTSDMYHIVPDFGNAYNRCDKRITYKFYDSPVWPKCVGKNLNMETFNAGRGGRSNGEILRTTINSIEYLERNGYTDIFVIIGWTAKTRQTIFTKNDDKKVFHREIIMAHDPEFDEYYKHTNLAIFDDDYLLSCILLQSFLNERGYKFLFFNAFDSFNEPNPLLKYLDTSKFINGSTSAHFREYIETKFNTHWGNYDEYFITTHPTDISHIEWSTYLTQYINDNEILK
jgi:hypothetical protein